MKTPTRTENMNRQTPYQAAVEYINMGLAVFPVVYKGKMPLTQNGCKDATTDAAVVKGWWQKWPNANIGIATGSKSGGLFVIDLDVDEDRGVNGYQTLRDWERDNGDLPETIQSITGRGGYHLFYRGNKLIGNRAKVMDGIDIRGEGGYIIAPPSIHPNGRMYEWEQGPNEYAIASANDHVYQLIEHRRESNTEFIVPEKVSAGERNQTMFRYACSLQSKGLSDEAILAAIKIENEKRCVPPLPDGELEKTIQSALKYEKGARILQFAKTGPAPPQPETQMVNLRYGENGKIQQTIENICEVLRNDPALKNHIRYNTLSYSPFIFDGVPWDPHIQYREWSNSDDSNLKCYIEGKYGLKNLGKIMEAFTVVSNENRFNPVTDYLESLEWDQKPHIENLLPDFLGVEKSPYSATCMKLFMLGAINRAYRPGCKFDYMPVLVGEQGVGKSTFFKLLAGKDEWYNDNFNTIDGDKAAEKLRGMWIVELAELLAVKRAQQVESIKAFITSTVDTYRPPYERITEQRPRVCVFAGTTNSSHFLTDRTGNRRYLPLMVNRQAIKRSMFERPDEVTAEFQQAWAEALYIFRTEDPRLVLPADLQAEAMRLQGDYVEEDVRIGIIQDWLDSTENRYVCTAMIYKEALGNDFTKPDRRTSNELHDIMQYSITGWRRVRNEHGGRKKLQGYGTQICYEREANSFSTCDTSQKAPFEV